jgi:peroxisomal 2,4-dienoyl-CoA reductase
MPSRPLPAEESPFKENAVAGRVVLITGGGSGIGFGIAKVLGSHGAKVVIMGRRKAFLEDAVTKLRSFGVDAACVAGDVRSEESAKAAVAFAVKQYGKLDTVSLQL